MTSKRFWVLIIELEEFRENVGNIVKISVIYQFGTDKLTIDCGAMCRAAGTNGKNPQFFRAFFWKFWKFIWQSDLKFWQSDDPYFTRVFIKASNGQICDLMAENQSWLDPTAAKCFQRLYDRIDRCFIFNNFKFDIISYRNLQYMFRKWLVEVEAVSWVEILVGNIVHLWKGTKMEQYAITVDWQ